MPKRIFVTRPITVNLDTGEAVKLTAGVHSVEAEVAEHWFVKANSQSFDDAVPDDAKEVVSALQAKLDELEKAKEILEGQLQEKDAKLQEQAGKLQAQGKQASADKKRIAELERQLQEKATADAKAAAAQDGKAG